MKIGPKIFAFTASTVLLGMLLSTQFQAQNAPERELYQQRPENLIAMVKSLSDKRQRLNLEVNDLSNQLYERRNTFENESLVRASLEQELAKLNIINGAVPVYGEGLEVVVFSSSLFQHQDLVSLVNELWAAGAEAVAVGQVRLNAYTPIYFQQGEEGLEITVNQRPVEWPLRVWAIGDSNNLEKGLSLPGGFIDMMGYNGIFPTLRQKERVELPAVRQSQTFSYMKEHLPPSQAVLNASK